MITYANARRREYRTIPGRNLRYTEGFYGAFGEVQLDGLSWARNMQSKWSRVWVYK